VLVVSSHACFAMRPAAAASQHSPYISSETYRRVTSRAGRLASVSGRVCGCSRQRMKFPTATSVLALSALTATQDWSPWLTPQIQTGMIASNAPRARSPVQSATSLGNGWCSHLPSQLVHSRTAPTVLPRSKPRSKPAFRRLCAGCGRAVGDHPWPPGGRS
jgi:hypothetical protein